MTKGDPLTKSVDMLFTLATFYALIQFPHLVTWQSKVLWVGLFLLILNEQISVRASYDVYNILIYSLDLVSLFLYVIAIHFLEVTDSQLGYNPSFWIPVGILWLSYAIWDLLMMPFADKQAKINLRKWAINMIIAFVATMMCYLLIIFAPSLFEESTFGSVQYIAQLLGFGIIIWALYLWNKDRVSRAMEIMNEAKGTKKF